MWTVPKWNMIVRLGESLWSWIGLLWIVSDVPTSSQTGLPRSRKSQGKTKIFQGQGKVCCFTCFSGGIFAGFVSDKTKCSGITVVFMLILAAPMVSQLHNCTRERLKESFLFDFLVAMHCYEASQRRVSGAKDFAVTALARIRRTILTTFLRRFATLNWLNTRRR